MRIAFDMDGTITEGRFIEPPRTYEMYMSLKPYDDGVQYVYNSLFRHSEIYIITARSDKRADSMITDWLDKYQMSIPTAIITNPVEGRKNPENGIWKADLVNLLGIDLMFDDSPNVWKMFQPSILEDFCYLMDNPNWPENQTIQTDTRITSWKDLGEIIERINNQKLQGLGSGI